MEIAPRKVGLPAIRYTTFIEAFEKAVAEHQQMIAELESGQAEYLACQEAIAKVAIPNDGSLKLDRGGASINIVAQPDDVRATFDALASAIGAALVERKLHGDGVPAMQTETIWYPDMIYRWRTKRVGKDGRPDIGTVALNVKIPREGIRDLRVEMIEVPTTNTHYLLVPRETVLPISAPPTGARVYDDLDNTLRF